MEIKNWETPFGSGELHIVSTHWGTRDWYVEYPDKKRYEIDNSFHSKDTELTITIFHVDTESVFEVTFDYIGAYRLLDEHGLMELWESGKVNSNCFMVKDHAWSKESVLSFFQCTTDGWSYLIASGNECIEVLSLSEPKINFVKKIKPVKS